MTSQNPDSPEMLKMDKELEACQWCKKLVPHLIQITDKPEKHDAQICEECYNKEFE